MAGRRGVKHAEATEQVRAENERPLRPAQCREYMRQTLAREFRGIVAGFVQEARSGSCQHVKLAAELVNAPPARRRRKGTLETILEKIERDRELRRQQEQEAGGRPC